MKGNLSNHFFLCALISLNSPKGSKQRTFPHKFVNTLRSAKQREHKKKHQTSDSDCLSSSIGMGKVFGVSRKAKRRNLILICTCVLRLAQINTWKRCQLLRYLRVLMCLAWRFKVLLRDENARRRRKIRRAWEACESRESEYSIFNYARRRLAKKV
jgi:hypothetical protein